MQQANERIRKMAATIGNRAVQVRKLALKTMTATVLVLAGMAVLAPISGDRDVGNGRAARFIETGAADVWAADEDTPADTQNVEGEGSPESTPCPECPDPAKVVLEGLEQKKKAIAEAEERLKEETKQLEAFKEEIDAKLEQLAKLKAQIETDFARLEKKKSDLELQKEAEFEAKMDRLVKVYSGMKPQNAAEIINQMDLEVARQIFARMRETAAAQILANVDSEKAAKISERIAFKKE